MSSDSKSKGWKYWVALVAILLMVIAYFVHDRNNRDANLSATDSTHFNELRQVMVLKAQGETRAEDEKRRLIEENRLREDSTNDVNDRLLAENKRLRGLIKPVRVVMAGDTAGMRAQLIIRDQAIENCDSSLLVKSGELTQAKAFCDSMQAIEAKKDKVQETAINALNAAAWDNADRASRLEKKLDNPWSFGLHAGYGATLSGGQVYMGPQAGASVQYKIRIRRKK